MRHTFRIFAAPTIALLLLSLAMALLAQAAPSSAPEPAQTTEGLVWVSVLASPDADVTRFFVGQVYRREIGSLVRIAGHVRAADLPALASRPGAIHIPSSDPPPTPPDPTYRDLPDAKETLEQRAAEQPLDRAPASPAGPTGWYENDTQGVHQTWGTYGITGTGVTIAVLDSGVDFGNPALAGRYAVQPATLSGTQAYAGWPIAFDDRSLSDYLSEPERDWNDGNWGWYVNANHAINGSNVFTFTDPLSPTNIYTAPGTSQSGMYYLGYHPDPSSAIAHAPILVADEAATGVYDAVYVDLNHDGTFETRTDKDDPVGAIDLTGDGVPDRSAGMVYWIADGTNPPPGAEAVYGSGVPVPPAGTLVAFMIDDLSLRGGGHGTMCAGTAVGYDDDSVFVPKSAVASFYTDTYGPLVQGPAPGAKVIAMGNVYAGGSLDAWHLFTIVGYDGVEGSGDEPQIVTLSYENSAIDNDGWDWESRYLTTLNLDYEEDSPLFIVSAGNGGFGYGTLTPPASGTRLIAGASTQYGTYNVWGISETVSLPERVNTGDVSAFSSRGPGADGARAVDLVANGMMGTSAYPLNACSNGTLCYTHWYGTSRSAPVAGGMAALVAQGFYQTHGRFPTYAELRLLLINGACDLGYDPLVQGAGQANVFRSTQLALGEYGVTVDPPTAVAGDYRGQRYPSFAEGLSRGEAQTLTFTVTNPGDAAAALTLTTQALVEVARYTRTIQTITDTATNSAYGAPDYALNLTDWIIAHPDADLMVVRMWEPFEHFDALTPTQVVSNGWWLMAYNWWDDGDGQWWTDLNSDGRVDWPGELDGSDEWMRFDFCSAWGYGTQQEVRVGQPYARSIGAGSGGIWAGAAHVTRSSGDNRTTLSFEVIFYAHATWTEASLSDSVLSVPTGSQTTFQATVQVPSDAPYGVHQGAILIEYPGGTDRTLIPLTYQVWPDPSTLDLRSASGQAGFTLGGTERADTPYDNGEIRGGFARGGRGASGDWRFHGFDLQDPPAGSAILIHNVWEDYPTDIDSLILGPVLDGFSDANPEWFGPYSLDIVGGSARAGNRPNWEFDTVTCDTEEWAFGPAQDGLHVLAQHGVLFGGHQASVLFTTTVGLIAVQPYPLWFAPDCETTCTLTATFRAGLDIAEGITVAYAFGWYTPTVQSTPLITEGGSIVHDVLLAQDPYRLDATLRQVAGAGDLDLYLYDDAGSTPGAWDAGDQLLEYETGPGVDKSLQARGLTADQYWIVVEGREVDAGGGSYSLEILTPPWDSYGAMSVSGLPAQVTAGQIVTFTVQATRPFTIGQQGLLVLGPPVIPTALEVPVLTEVHDVYLPLMLRNQ
jgi:hypothetical protein